MPTIRLKFNEEENTMSRLTRDEQIKLLEDLVTTMVRSIAEKPNEVYVTRVVTSHNLVFEVEVANTDMGLVLGREGSTAESMRGVLYVACKKTDFKVHLDVTTKDRRRGG